MLKVLVMAMALAAAAAPAGAQLFGRQHPELLDPEKAFRISARPLAGVEIPRGKAKEDATSRGCSDKGVCYIPITQTVRVRLPGGKS